MIALFFQTYSVECLRVSIPSSIFISAVGEKERVEAEGIEIAYSALIPPLHVTLIIDLWGNIQTAVMKK